MRYAVIADLHANLEALQAVLADAAAMNVSRLLCLGDVVGYHADPDACIELLRAHNTVCIAGNHDLVAAGLAEPEHFGAAARRAILWTRAHLSPASLTFLEALPRTALVDARVLLFHGALHPRPNADQHLSNAARVRRTLRCLQEGPWRVHLAFFGHTHRSVVHDTRGVSGMPAGQEWELAANTHTLINPGSVGQPRDGDPRAAYAIFDASARRITFRRILFDREACLRKVARAGLPLDAGQSFSPGHKLTSRLSALMRRIM